MEVKVINLADKKEYVILAPKTGENTMTCPVCSEGRKKKTDKCFGYNVKKGAGRCNHCGIVLLEKKDFEKRPQIEYKRPIWKNGTTLSEKLVKWFEGRKITQKTLLEFKVTEGKEFMPQIKAEINTIQFNYFRDGELVNVKYRDSRKNFKLVKDAELIFYNLDCAINATELFIVEGEMDALSLAEAGYKNVLSVPNGANLNKNNLAYLDNCIERLEGSTFVLALDNDQAGRSLRDELCRRLGVENCFKVEFKDCKDANECLMKYGIQGIIESISDKKEFPIVGVFSANDIEGEIDSYYNNGLPSGDGIGIAEFDKLLKFQPGYITTITGIPGHGKSEVLDFICSKLNFLHGWKFGLYSPENHPLELHFSKLAEKFIGKPFEGPNKMNHVELNQFKRYFNDNFFFIKPSEDFTLDNIIATVKALVRKKGIKGFVIDAWNKLDHQFTGNETQYISKQLDKLALFCETSGVHLFLVAHPTKIQKDKQTGFYEVPNLYSISGSANFYNKTSNGLSVYRNYGSHTTDVYIQKVKFKHWGMIGQVNWGWDRSTGRYYSGMPDTFNWLQMNEKQASLQENKTFMDQGIVMNNEEPPF